MSLILGISAFYHDSAAVLLKSGEIDTAVQEERFTRIKNDSSFPTNSVLYILKKSKLRLTDIDHIVFYEKPFLKFERLLETYVSFAPKGFQSFRKSMPIWMQNKLYQKKIIIDELKKIDDAFTSSNKILFSEHHLSHAASAYYPSKFDDAVILTLDAVGEWSTSSVYIGEGNKITRKKEIEFPHSLGLLYSAFTQYCGFEVNNGEYKLMGLAPYGDPIFKDLILAKMLDLKSDGSFRLNMKYFNYATGLTMINKNFEKIFNFPARKEGDEIKKHYMDVAASIQAVLEDVVLKITRALYSEYNIQNLCLAGGVALNCVANGIIKKKSGFKNIWIQPAAGDAGGALGAALAIWHIHLDKEKKNTQDKMKFAYLGSEYSQVEIENELNNVNAKYNTYSDEDIIKKIVEAIKQDKIVGLFRGKMEFGPRALGNRSIIADPRSINMQRNLNLKIKFRESFRPFAPVILKDKVSDWFNFDDESPYMLLVAYIKDEQQKKLSSDDINKEGLDRLYIHRSTIPAVTHVNNTSRLHTLDKEQNPFLYKIIEKFNSFTDCPLLVNTSFNVKDEPIVESPADAYRCFMSTEIDLLVCGNSLLEKSEQLS